MWVTVCIGYRTRTLVSEWMGQVRGTEGQDLTEIGQATVRRLRRRLRGRVTRIDYVEVKRISQ